MSPTRTSLDWLKKFFYNIGSVTTLFLSELLTIWNLVESSAIWLEKTGRETSLGLKTKSSVFPTFRLRCLFELQVVTSRVQIKKKKSADEYTEPELKKKVEARDINLEVVSI